MNSPVLRAFFLFLCAAIGLQAQIVTYTWTGAAGYSDWSAPANWLGNSVPVEDVANTRIVFGNTRGAHIDYSEIHVNQLSFQGNTQPFELHGGWDTTHIGSGGIVYNPAQPVHSFLMDAVQLEASQTWDIQNGKFIVEGPMSDTRYDPLANAGAGAYVSDNYKITKTGAGTLVLENNGSNSWSGGLILSQGKVVINPAYDTTNYNLGTGTLTFNGGTLVAREDNDYGDPVYIENNVVSNGLISTQNETDLHVGYSGDGNSIIELTANTTVQSSGKPLYLEGNITQTGGEAGTARSLTVNSNGAVVLTGTNSYTGGTAATNGVLIFGNDYSIPETGAITIAANGYAGIGSPAGQAKFFSKMTPASVLGTVGFDSDPEGSPNTFTDPVILTNFGTTARLGSATQAILGTAAVITPQGTAYRFGGGGGFLQVDSQLTDQSTPTAAPRSLVVDSPAAAPLTLRLTYTGNNYTGGTTVSNSALIFGSSLGTGTFPNGTRNITINNGGYVGFEIWGDQSDANLVLNSLTKINTASVGAVGFDGNNGYYILPNTAPIDLSLFPNALYLGTSTKGVEGPGLTVSGTITPAGGATAPYRFAGYKGGALLIESTLTGAYGVHIADPNSPGTFGDYISETYSTVGLTGNNSALTGNVTLYGGQLLVGQSNGISGSDPTTALGWNTTTSTGGTLVVQGMTLPPEWQEGDEEAPAPQLGTITDGLIIPNNIILNTDLNIAESSDFTLTGKISGAGEIYLESGDSGYPTKLTLGHTTLGGDTNDFTGGIYLSGYSRLDVAQNHATGTGPLGFGYGSSAEVYFKTLAPVIGGLMSKDYGDSATLYAEQTNTVLTINQSFDSKFSGYFRSTKFNSPTPDDNFRIVKEGTGTLRLDQGGMNFYHGTTEATLAGTPEVSLQIKQGTLVIGNNFNLQETSPTTIWVNGGTLALERDPTYYYNFINNPIVVDNNGRLAGNGAFNSSIQIGAGAILAPGHAGQDPTGFLAIDHLELNSGGIYEWQIQDPSAMGHAGRDLIKVGVDEYAATLAIKAGTTLDDPLTTTVNEDNRFTLKIISLTAAGTPGLLSGFDPTIGYSWMLINYDVMDPLAGFDSAKFNLDTSGFANSLVGGPDGKGVFYLTDTGSQIMLNFAPIPEPSTYALLALGLGIIGLTAWRKRRAS